MAEYLRDAAQPELAPIAATLTGDSDADVARAAESALLRTAIEAGDHDGRRLVAGAIAAALRSFGTHGRRGVLTALVSASPPDAAREPDDDLRRWLHDPTGPGRAALSGLLRSSADAATRVRALEWLAIDAWGAACLDRLSRASTREEHDVVLARWALFRRPKRSRRLALLGTRASARGGALPAGAVVASLSEPARVGAAAACVAMNVPVSARRDALSALLADPSPRVRHAVVLASGHRDLTDFAFDNNECVARSAAIRMSAAVAGVAPRAENARVWRLLARSPHAPVRAVAAAESAWSARRETTRADTRAQRVSEIRGLLASSDRDLRGQGLRRVRDLRVAADVEPELVELAREKGDPASAATAVALLGGVGGDSSWSAITHAARAGDPRVRANAAEALGRRGLDVPSARDTLVELKEDPHHRVATTAVRALVRLTRGDLDDAAEILARGLRDGRPERRAASAWLATVLLPGPLWRHAGFNGLAAATMELAAGDGDPRVRRRALACSSLLRELGGCDREEAAA